MYIEGRQLEEPAQYTTGLKEGHDEITHKVNYAGDNPKSPPGQYQMSR